MVDQRTARVGQRSEVVSARLIALAPIDAQPKARASILTQMATTRLVSNRFLTWPFAPTQHAAAMHTSVPRARRALSDTAEWEAQPQRSTSPCRKSRFRERSLLRV